MCVQKDIKARRGRSLCLLCGKRPPEPNRSTCASFCGKGNSAGRTRDARLRAEGLPRQDPDRAKEYEREPQASRRAEGDLHLHILRPGSGSSGPHHLHALRRETLRPGPCPQRAGEGGGDPLRQPRPRVRPFRGLGQYGSVDPHIIEPLSDLAPAFRVKPARSKLGGVWVECSSLLVGVVGQLLAGQPPPVHIALVDQMPDDLDLLIVHTEHPRTGIVAPIQRRSVVGSTP